MRTKAENKTRKYWTWFFLASVAGGIVVCLSPIVWENLAWQWRAAMGAGMFGLMFLPLFVREPRHMDPDA